MAIDYIIREDVYIQQCLNKLLPDNAITDIKIFDNSKTSLILTKDPESQNRIKHIIDINHYLCEFVENKLNGSIV